MAHPNLSNKINAQLDDPERGNDLDLRGVGRGVSIVFWTRNTRYTITRDHNHIEWPNDAGHLWLVTGNPKYFPTLTPTRCYISGSTWGGSMLKMNHIGVGMHVEIVPQEGPYVGKTITTSSVVRIGDLPLRGGVS